MNRYPKALKIFMIAAAGMAVIAAAPASSSKAGGQGSEAALTKAWSAWKNGEAPEAEKLAMQARDLDPGRHLLMLCAFVQGKYEEALELYGEISPAYPRHGELNLPAAMSYLHLGRYEEAGRFVKENKIIYPPDELHSDLIPILAEHQLKVSLNFVTTIPFAQRIESAYFPAFPCRINNAKMVVHLDTGGTFLYLGPRRAKKLGIEPLRCSQVQANTGKGHRSDYQLCAGIAKSFQLGDARLENVPVFILPSFDQPLYDYVVFGTSVLEQFLSTVDYPNRRLILSPRNRPELRKQHLAMLPGNAVEVPFYLWSTHLMFVKGGVAEHKNLNLIIDTGLVDFRMDQRLRIRQAGFIAPREHFYEWSGLPESPSAKQDFAAPCSLGPLEQKDCMITLERPRLTLAEDFGGLRIDGLLAHAFMKHYCWTLDFERRVYILR